jgi:hypothetical protein
MKQAKRRFGYLFLHKELGDKEKPLRWASHRAAFPARRREDGPVAARLFALSVLLAALIGLYFKLAH